ncbi:MraY family glycosyltransferase [Vaginisenegalia massiliensis]|uniref:MraY family glycosyltransferase n=1 Tax=Vaginisenegalia massiliensis TaxID=2058294 RepID=UPI000F53B77C|nr:MraY family glycosyltransferase [Vaginisenegalia massiliensis]
MLAEFIMPFLVTAGLSFFLTASLVKLAKRYRWLDRDPHKLKPDQERVPSFGGVALYLSFWLGSAWLMPFNLFTLEQWSIFLAASCVLLVGLADDIWELRPWQKSVGILLGAHIIYFMGDIQFSTTLLPEVSPWMFNLISYLLTIAWIFFVTNAINLLDGIDGLAASLSMTSLVTLIITTYFFSLSIRFSFLAMLILLVAAIIGFLPFNWCPAKIYLGDTGALFIGFMYATLTVSNLKNASFFSLLLPVILYVVPLFDAFYAAFRRILKGQSPVRADQEHLHHRLLRLGLKESQVVWAMLGITMVFSLLALFIQVFNQWRQEILLLVGVMLIGLVVIMAKLAGKPKG